MCLHGKQICGQGLATDIYAVVGLEVCYNLCINLLYVFHMAVFVVFVVFYYLIQLSFLEYIYLYLHKSQFQMIDGDRQRKNTSFLVPLGNFIS